MITGSSSRKNSRIRLVCSCLKMGSSKDWTRERVDPASFYWQLLMGFTRVLIGSLRPGGGGGTYCYGIYGDAPPEKGTI